MSVFFQVLSQASFGAGAGYGCADSCGVDSSQPLIIARWSSAIAHHTKYLSYQDKPERWGGAVIFSPAYNGLQIPGKSKPSEDKNLVRISDW